MNRGILVVVLLVVAGCASDPTFTQAERISFALTPTNVHRVQFWTVHTFQLRGATELASQGETAVSAGVQYRESVTVKDGTPAIIVEMPDEESVIADVGLVLDPLNLNLTEPLLIGFSANEEGLYTLRTVAGQSVGGPIKLGEEEYAYFTCKSGTTSQKCTNTLPLGAEEDPSVTLRFKATAIERSSGVSGRYITP